MTGALAPATLPTVNLLPEIMSFGSGGAPQPSEALFLTFGADLAMFENRALGICQSMGARVTVLADAGVWAPDARAVRHAGRSYHAGLATVGGAFHPKLVVIAGPKRALVAVGSGNLTLGGWLYNRELWTILTGNEHQAPKIFADIAKFLSHLPQSIRTDGLSADALRRTAAQLTSLTTSAELLDTRHQFVNNCTRSLINQLPAGPVDALNLYAPFHDPGGLAVAALINRFRPAKANILVQPGMTVIEPAQLRLQLEDLGVPVTITADPEAASAKPRYRHGKLIEWVSSTQRFALVGSANLSVAALLRTVANGGNCEAGLITELPTTLFPDGDPIDLATIPAHRIEAPTEQVARREAPQLIAAHIVGEGIALTLAAPNPRPATAEISMRSQAPDRWEPLGDVTVGCESIEFSVEPEAGSRIRLTWNDNHGIDQAGPVLFIVDHAAVLRFPNASRAKSRPDPVTSGALLADNQELLELLIGEFQALAADGRTSAAGRIPKPRAATETDEHDRTQPDASERPNPWRWEVEAAQAAHGTSMTALFLSLPLRSSLGGEAVAWEDKLVDDAEEGAETPDTPDGQGPSEDPEASEDQEPESQADHNRREAARALGRRYATCATECCAQLPPTSRILALLWTLVVHSQRSWDDGDAEPLRLIAQQLEHLDAAGCGPKIEARVGSIAAVAMTILRDSADFSGSGEVSAIYARTIQTCGAWLLAADDDLIAHYCRFVTNFYGFPLRPDDVTKLASAVLNNDHVSDATTSLQRAGYNVTPVAPTVLRIDGTMSNTDGPALRAIAMMEQAPLAGVQVVGSGGRWSLAAWRKPDLVLITLTPRGPRWLHYRLPPLCPPSSFRTLHADDPSRYRQQHGPTLRPFAEGTDILDHLGLTSPDPE